MTHKKNLDQITDWPIFLPENNIVYNGCMVQHVHSYNSNFPEEFAAQKRVITLGNISKAHSTHSWLTTQLCACA